MVEQLCYTWSSIGLSGSTGVQVRAASNGVADIKSMRFAAFDPYLRYTLPTGSDRSRATMDTSPWCLAYVDADKERVAVHKVYTGRDKVGRPGVYFAHLLAELPESFSVRDAIDMWKSPFWLLSESSLDPRSVKLPPVAPYQLEHGSRASYDLKVLQEYLPFVMRAFLALKDDQQFYIAAPDTQTATLIWGLAHSLPLPMLKSLTFSTYEHDLNDASMSIVGTCRPYTGNGPSRQDALPANAYNGRGLFLNCYTGDRSQIETQLSPQLQDELDEYIEFAVRCLLTGAQYGLDNDVITIAEKRNIDDIEAFLSLFKHSSARQLAPKDITNILKQPGLAVDLLPMGNIQRNILNLTITDPQWWETSGKEALTNLYQHYRLHPDKDATEALAALNARIIDETCSALRDPQSKPLFTLIQLLDAVAPANIDPSPWVQLLNVLSQRTVGDLHWKPSRVYKWSNRKQFLQRWAHGVQSIPIEQIIPWLQDISWGEDLGTLLSGDLPHNWKLQALVPLITSPSGPLPQFAVEIVANHAHEFNLVLKFLIEEGSTQQLALGFFVWMVKYNYPHKVDMLAILLFTEASRLDTDDVLSKAALSPEETFLFFSTYGTTLLTKRSAGGISRFARDMARSYVQSFALNDCKQRESRDLLKLMEQKQTFDVLDRETQQRLVDWHNVSLIVTQNHQFYQVDNKYFHAIGRAVERLELAAQKGFPEFKDQLFDRVVNTRWSNQEELHTALTDLSPSLIRLSEKDARKANYANMVLLYQLAKFMGRYLPPPFILIPYIMLSITYDADLKGTKKEEFVILLETLLKGIDRETFDAIENEAQGWPGPIRKEWQRYGASLAPKTIGERVGGVVGAVGRIVPKPSETPQPGNKAIEQTASKQSGMLSTIKAIAFSSKKPTQSTIDQQANALSPEQQPLSPIPDNSLSQPASSNTPNKNILQPVSEEWINKVVEVKTFYVDYRSQVIDSEFKKLVSKGNMSSLEERRWQYLASEQDKLLELNRVRERNDYQEWVQKVQEDLWIDQLIEHYLHKLGEMDQTWIRWRDTSLQNQHGKVCKKFKQQFQGNYQKWSREKGITEKDIEDILRLFVRYYYLALNLYCGDDQARILDEKLRPLKTQFPFEAMPILRSAN